MINPWQKTAASHSPPESGAKQMNTELLHVRLDSIVTKHDIAASKRRGYNPSALGIYLERVGRVVDLVKKGTPLAEAIDANFNDRLAAKRHKVKI